MAATVPTDPYAIFMRKIGYSVGLENTFDRINDLLRTYLRNRDLTLASWAQQVADWGLKSENIADVFFSLRLIHRTPGDVLVLENLDAMAIADSLLEEPSQASEACAFIFLWAVLVNDGEIFVNLLLSDFEERRIKETLSTMMQNKRASLAESATGRGAIARINRIVNIDRQQTNRGSAGAGRSVASLRRTEPLRPRAANRSASPTGEIVFSDDYLRKVPPKRRDWAHTLGLWDKATGLTQRGDRFIRGLTDSGYIGPEGAFAFWPMDYELRRSGFHAKQVPRAPRSLWATLLDFARAYSQLEQKETTSADRGRAVTLVAKVADVFRTLHVRKAMLRREVPVLVAFPAVIACAAGTRTPVLNLPDAIEAEQRGEQRRIAFRQSRNTGGALTVRT